MTVVVAYSPDRYGRAALEYGAAEASRRRTRLLVFNGTKGDAYVDLGFAHVGDLNALGEDLTRLGIEHEVRHEVVDDVAEGVVAAAVEVGAELVVVGVRRRTPVGKLLLGSIAQRVIIDAPCPVLAVKPEAED